MIKYYNGTGAERSRCAEGINNEALDADRIEKQCMELAVVVDSVRAALTFTFFSSLSTQRNAGLKQTNFRLLVIFSFLD